MEESLIRMTEYQKCLYSMAKDPEAVAKIEYPSHARMVQDGTSHLWNIIKVKVVICRLLMCYMPFKDCIIFYKLM